LADGASSATDCNRARSPRLHARDQLRKLNEVAPVEWQVHDLGAIDNGAHGGIVGLKSDGKSFNVDRLGDVADPELQGHPRGLLDLQCDAINLLCLESRR